MHMQTNRPGGLRCCCCFSDQKFPFIYFFPSACRVGDCEPNLVYKRFLMDGCASERAAAFDRFSFRLI